MTWVFVKRAGLAGAGFFALAGLTPAYAVNVQPLSLEMVSIGSNSRASIQVVNDGAAPMPVEVVLKKLEIAEDGKTTESLRERRIPCVSTASRRSRRRYAKLPRPVDWGARHQEKPDLHALREPASCEDEAW